MYKVAFILINFHSSAYTLACIASILAHTARTMRFQIIVVDNDSSPEDYSRLVAGTATLPVTLVRSRINLGFSGGNMLGAQQADAQYLYFLNNDCELLNDNAAIFSAFMESRPQAGICSGQMHDGEKRPVCSFGYFPSAALSLLGSSIMRLLAPGEYPSRRIRHEQPVRVPLVSGAAMFVDSAKFASIGGFDTNLFLYCEEEDLAATMRARGYQCWSVPAGHYLHHMGKSTRRTIAIEREYYISLMYYLRKHTGLIGYSVLKLTACLKVLKQSLQRKSDPRLALFILRGAPMRTSLRFRQTISPPLPQSLEKG